MPRCLIECVWYFNKKTILFVFSGCGNGRYMSINSSTFKVGVDMCKPLVDNSRSKGHEVAYADNLYLPFR